VTGHIDWLDHDDTERLEDMKDQLSRAEIRKDALQDGVTAASHAVGSVATIITGAVGDIARAVGGFATEIFEIRDAARRAGQDHVRVVPSEPLDQPKDI
jgi:hypothetical protein